MCIQVLLVTKKRKEKYIVVQYQTWTDPNGWGQRTETKPRDKIYPEGSHMYAARHCLCAIDDGDFSVSANSDLLDLTRRLHGISTREEIIITC